MKIQKRIPPTGQSNPDDNQRTDWERLSETGGVAEEKLAVWGSDEAWAVVEKQQWHFEFRSRTCNGTFEKPYKFRYLELKKHSPQPPGAGAKLVLTFDARSLELRPIWPRLVDHVLDAIAKSRKSRPDGIIKALKEWKHNWPKEKGFENPAFIQGLFGELCLINWFLENGVYAETALRAWVGPNKRLHDFQFQGSHVEVKANASKRRVVTISDLRQLDESSASPGELFLAHMKLVRIQKKEHSLSALVGKIEQKLTDSEKDLLTTKLMISRWFQIPAKVRDETIFFSHPPEFFTVIRDFPRLLGNDLRTDVAVTTYKIVLPAPAANGEFSVDGAKVLASLG